MDMIDVFIIAADDMDAMSLFRKSQSALKLIQPPTPRYSGGILNLDDDITDSSLSQISETMLVLK